MYSLTTYPPSSLSLPDLTVATLSASSTNVASSQEITLTVLISNVGNRSSTSTILRWYLSTDSTITTADTPVGTNALSSLAMGMSVTISNTITVPNTISTNYYGACVDPVMGEVETANNCSSAVRVVVILSANLLTIDFNILSAVDNRNPRGIWSDHFVSGSDWSDDTTMWVADWGDAKLYAYDLATKARNTNEDFNTLSAAGNNNPTGIWSDGTTLWVADWIDDKLYAYDARELVNPNSLSSLLTRVAEIATGPEPHRQHKLKQDQRRSL